MKHFIAGSTGKSAIKMCIRDRYKVSIIQFKEANCKNCYKCIRSCQVKSIAFKNEQAEITEKECILCGHCFLVCPQNAK